VLVVMVSYQYFIYLFGHQDEQSLMKNCIGIAYGREDF
jgi:hypothetical protein